MLDLNEALELSEARAAAYSSLSRLFRREADRDLLAGWAEANIGSQWGFARTDACCADADADADPDENADAALSELASDYAQLFLMGKRSVHPYESAYTSDKGLLMQEAFRDARRCYASAGFVVSNESKEMADHVALELEFMALLAGRMRDALAQGNAEAARTALARQRAFHRIHLHWIARFASDVEAQARTSLYRGAAQLLNGVVASDASFMGELDEALSTVAPQRAQTVA